MTLLAPVESRFPLSCGRVPDTVGNTGVDDPAASGRRRFGLRFFVPDRPVTEPMSGYCERRQVTVDDDGRPVVHGPHAGWERTSTGSMDGAG